MKEFCHNLNLAAIDNDLIEANVATYPPDYSRYEVKVRSLMRSRRTRRSRFSEEQIIGILNEHQAATFYNWRSERLTFWDLAPSLL